MLGQRRADLVQFLTADDRGKLLPDYLLQLAELMSSEHGEMLSEIDQLNKRIEHIKQIVATQQGFARRGGDVAETFDVIGLVEDAIRINAETLDRHGIKLIRAFSACGPVTVDRHKVLQIVVNLIANAKNAMRDVPEAAERSLTIRLGPAVAEDDITPIVRLQVIDTGTGIKPEDMPKLFRLGFTTHSEGHGFGLHFCANVARQMKGSLTAHSDGPGRGAAFALDLPLEKREASVA